MTLIESVYSSFSIFLASFSVVGYFPFFRAVLKQQHSGNYMWRMSLAISDILIATNVMLYANKVYDGLGRDIGCQMVAFLALGFGFVNIANAAFIAYDKRCEVNSTSRGSFAGLITLIAVWTLSFITGSLPLAGLGQFEKIKVGHVSCLLDLHSNSTKFYVFLVATTWFVAPVALMIRSYFDVYQNSRENRMLSILAPGILLICYLPFTIHCLLSVIFGSTTPLFWMQIVNIMPKLLSVVNPFIYMNFDPEMKFHKSSHDSAATCKEKAM